MQDPFEIILCSFFKSLLFTPWTTVKSTSLAGADIITFLAPASICLPADFLSKKKKSLYIEKASILVEALPYIREHSGKVVVIKYGGNAMINKELAESFSKDIGLLIQYWLLTIDLQ